MGHRLGKMRLLVLFLSSLVASATAELTVIQEDGWRQLLKGEWMVEFAAPWCPACRALQPTWEDFAGWSEDLEVGERIRPSSLALAPCPRDCTSCRPCQACPQNSHERSHG